MSYVYETKIVKKPRSSKICAMCEKKLPKGVSHIQITWYCGEFLDSRACSEECKDEFEKSLIV